MGTLSRPDCLLKGLHLKSLEIVNFSPIKNPHCAKLSLAYCEQVGVNLHVWGIKGDMQNLNNKIKPSAIYLGILIIAFSTFFIVFL